MTEMLLGNVTIREISTGKACFLDAFQQAMLVLVSCNSQSNQYMSHLSALQSIRELRNTSILDHFPAESMQGSWLLGHLN
jgi:hypothetical protein